MVSKPLIFIVLYYSTKLTSYRIRELGICYYFINLNACTCTELFLPGELFLQVIILACNHITFIFLLLKMFYTKRK